VDAQPLPIEFRELTKDFGVVRAVQRLSVSALPGRVTAFLGPNGAGKTSTLRMLVQLVRPTSGSATFGGRTYDALPHPVRTVGTLLEAEGFHPSRTAVDHLRVVATQAGLPRAAPERVLEEVGLAEVAATRVGTFSLGMRQRLGLATALLGDPPILVLDEPGNGLDPSGVRWLRGFLRDRAAQGSTVLLSSHVLSEVELIADDLIVMARGELVAAGPLPEVQSRFGFGTLVRGPDLRRLRALLQSSGYDIRRDDGHELIVAVAPELVGELAAEHGVVLHRLGAKAGLEDAFLRLTEEAP
jgi:ABC-2 type transport system ATP-binding protein